MVLITLPPRVRSFGRFTLAALLATVALLATDRHALAFNIAVNTNCTLQEAVTTAHNRLANPSQNPPPNPEPGCTVNTDGSTGFQINLPGSGITLNAPIQILFSMTIAGTSRAASVITTSGANAFRVANNPRPNPRLILRRLTLRGSQNPAINQAIFVGPGDSHVTLDDVLVTNYATAVRVDSPTVDDGSDFSDAVIQSSTIETNSQAGVLSTNSNITVIGSTIATNNGGGIRATLTNELVGVDISGSTIRNNRAQDGAGVFVTFDGAGPELFQLTVVNSTFSNNIATRNGGGIFLRGVADVTTGTFTSNSAVSGGGVFLAFTSSGSTDLTARQSTFENNTATNGGGLTVDGQNNPSVQAHLVQSLLTGNTVTGTNGTTGNGGAVFSTGQIELDNTTIYKNNARQGAGLYHDGQEIHLRNCTVAGNIASVRGGGVLARAGNPQVVFNIIGTNTGGTAPDWGLIGPDPQTKIGGSNVIQSRGDLPNPEEKFPTTGVDPNIIANPLVATALQNLGGPTRVLPLQNGSPAIDAVPVLGHETFTNVDQRNVGRPLNGNDGATPPRDGFDIGAFEAPGNLSALSTTTAQASSQLNTTTRAAANAKDKSTSTRWEAANNSVNAWLRMNFSSSKSVTSVTLRGFNNTITGYRIERLSGSTWSTVVTGPSALGSSPRTHAFTAVSTTAIRIFITGTNGSPSMTEFEVY